MELNEQSVAAHKTILENPSAYGFSFLPLQDCFEPSDIAIPKHILFKQYLDYISIPLAKVFFYIIMDGMYSVAKAPNGDLGYKVKFTPVQVQIQV